MLQLSVNRNLNRLLSNKLNQLNQFKYLKTTTSLRSNNNNLNQDNIQNNNNNESITNELINEQNKNNNQITIKDEKYLELREKAVDELKREYIKKLESFTPWRKNYEDKLSKRKIPLPFSLTGFGDCSKDTKVWVQRIKTTLDEIINLKVKETYFDKLPASIHYLLENKPDQLDPKYQLLKDRFNKEKEKLINELELMNEEKINKVINLPFNLKENIKNVYTSNELDKKKKLDTELVDRDYEEYKKHHHLLEFVANKFGGNATNFEVGEELIALSNTMWHRDYGSENSKIKPSNVPCSGCGSNLHCTSTSIPGYIPYEKFINLNEKELRYSLCQRCDFLDKYNISLNLNVDNQIYEDIISTIKNKPGLILLMIDIIDFPCSVNNKILELIGNNRKVFIIVNKLDLLPKDGNNYLNRIKETICKNINLKERIVKSKDVFLISAKTGFGLDNLISSIYKYDKGKQDIYLLGCTNVGKSTLFNNLLQSDLCRLRQFDLIQRATTSIWPGTTLNLLKFPIRPLPAWEHELCRRRVFLKTLKSSLNEIELRRSMKYQPEDKNLFLKMQNKIGLTSQKELPFKFDSNHPLAKCLKKPPKPFDGDHPAFLNSNFLYDTPGTIFKEQIINLLTTEELLKTLPRKTIRPRTFTLEPFQTLFIGGLGRLDLLHSRDSILVTVFASDYLPVHIVDLEQAKKFYELYLHTDLLGVPINDPKRIEQWPSLISQDFHIKNQRTHQNHIMGKEKTSLCDIVFSSAGWAALTLENGSESIVKAYTPEGRGIYLREPALLPRAVLFKGPKIAGTPCFGFHSSFLNELKDDVKLVKKIEDDSHLPIYLGNLLIQHPKK